MNNTKVSLAPDRSASLSGTVDVKLNGTSIWNTTKVNLMINEGKTLTINLDNQATSNHFQGQPIYGVVESMRFDWQRDAKSTTTGSTENGKVEGT